MSWEYEFNRKNYPEVYFDFRLKKDSESYAIDTNVVLYPRKNMRGFFNTARITIYPVILYEIYYFTKRKKRSFEYYRRMLNKKNIRFAMFRMKCGKEFEEEINRGIISKSDATFLTYAKKENACIISFDNGVNEVAFRHDIPLWDTRVTPRLPKTDEIKFKGSWKIKDNKKKKRVIDLKVKGKY